MTTKSAQSMASNILYGHPKGDGTLREWTISDLNRSYNVAYRWAEAILKLRNRARFLKEQMKSESAAVGWYAKQIDSILKMRDPEKFDPDASAKARRSWHKI